MSIKTTRKNRGAGCFNAGVKKVFQTWSLFLLWAEDGGDATFWATTFPNEGSFFEIKFFASKKVITERIATVAVSAVTRAKMDLARFDKADPSGCQLCWRGGAIPPTSGRASTKSNGRCG